MEGLKVLVNTIVSPKEAFEAIKERPTWFVGLISAIVIGVIGTYLSSPAFAHAISANPAALFGDKAATMTPEQIQNATQMSIGITKFYWIFAIFGYPIFCAIGALVMLIFNAMGRGEGNYARYWAAQCNIAIIAALATLTQAVIVIARGADSFNSMRDVTTAVPSLAWIIPGLGVKLTTFFAVMTPFNLWAIGLTIYAMLVIGRVPKLQAWLTGLVLLIVPAALASLGAK